LKEHISEPEEKDEDVNMEEVEDQHEAVDLEELVVDNSPVRVELS